MSDNRILIGIIVVFPIAIAIVTLHFSRLLYPLKKVAQEIGNPKEKK
jgi:hypothetical protein